MANLPKAPVRVETLTHTDATRKNIPTAEYQSVLDAAQKSPLRVAYERRNRDLDPQLVWRGKDMQDWSDLVVHAPPLYIQEKIHPKVLIDDLKRYLPSPASGRGAGGEGAPQAREPQAQIDLFADFNGIPDSADKTDFYQHDAHWSNRMILGDSLQIMASLAEREGLRGQVQCIYFDPPYGIKFNSNFQWSTTSRDVKDGSASHITREPEQVKAFRDTWRDGIHSYLTYLRDRLTVARDLLTDSGSIFVQIGDENVHRVRAVMDEVFGDQNAVVTIYFRKTTTQSGDFLADTNDYLLWYAKDKSLAKFRPLQQEREGFDWVNYDFVMSTELRLRKIIKTEKQGADFLAEGERVYRRSPLTSTSASASTLVPFEFEGQTYRPGKGGWKTNQIGLSRLSKSFRIETYGSTASFRRFTSDFPFFPISNSWIDTASGGYGVDKTYVVQTNTKVVERCVLMTTDPGDLVLDPTCGSGTTAYVAEQWGRRWITLDTSRVALALARARIMGARYPYYLLADSPEGKRKEMEIVGRVSDSVTRQSAPQPAPQTSGYAALTRPTAMAAQGNVRHGFVYERVPHITLKSIANNAEIDVIWDKWQQTLEPLREQLNAALGRVGKAQRAHADGTPRDGANGGHGHAAFAHPTNPPSLRATEGSVAISARSPRPSGPRDDEWEEWQIPRDADPNWPDAAQKLHADWWQARIARQREIDKSIAAKADSEYLYDKPHADNKRVRVAGPFTVESLSPHRVLGVDENDELIDPLDQAKETGADYGSQPRDFVTIILENLRTAGVQQAHKDDRISFTSLVPWPGDLVCAEGRYTLSPGPSPASGRGEKNGTEAAQSEPSPPDGGRGQGEGGETQKRAAIFVGPEFGTVSRPDLVEAAREAGDAGFDVLIACAFNYDAHASEFAKLGRIPVLKARMNADLHMAKDLKNTGKGNLFVIFGEPDIDILDAPDGQYQVKVNGVDVFDPSTGEVRSDSASGIACWFIDTDYNEESFFVRHAYFLGANDPYKALKTTLKAEIDEDAWASLNSDVSRPFAKPSSGRIAVKVINHLGDEVMKVFRV